MVKMWLEVQMVLAEATDKLSQQEILQRWPSEEGPPDRTTLSRWLKRAAQQGLICCSGSGYRGNSFRYWLPGREPLMWPGRDASEADKSKPGATASRTTIAACARRMPPMGVSCETRGGSVAGPNVPEYSLNDSECRVPEC
jgi:hypothetical protein